MTYLVKDLIVCREYQSNGIGAILMKAVEDYIINCIKNGWETAVMLMALKESIPFYEKTGLFIFPI